MKIRITKEFDFEAAHALDGYDGKCKNIHGHSYHLTVTFIGSPIENRTVSECGMVIDFGEIKSFVNKNVFVCLTNLESAHLILYVTIYQKS